MLYVRFDGKSRDDGISMERQVYLDIFRHAESNDEERRTNRRYRPASAPQTRTNNAPAAPAVGLHVLHIIMISRGGIIFGCLLLTVAIILGMVTGIIGISYPVRVDVTSLKTTIKVERFTENQIELSDGRVITLSDAYADHVWQDRIVYSKNQVDLEGDADGSDVWIYGDRKFKLCGTPWEQPIRIPIIPNRIHMNFRDLIAVGKITRLAERPDAPQQDTKPADKVPALVQPPLPTTTDAHR